MDPAVPQMVSFLPHAAAAKAGTDKIVAMWALGPFADNHGWYHILGLSGLLFASFSYTTSMAIHVVVFSVGGGRWGGWGYSMWIITAVLQGVGADTVHHKHACSRIWYGRPVWSNPLSFTNVNQFVTCKSRPTREHSFEGVHTIHTHTPPVSYTHLTLPTMAVV